MLWVDIALGVSACVAALSTVGVIIVKALTASIHKAVSEQVEPIKIELAKQFGGNSGGMRQAINEVASEIAYVKGALGLTKDH